MDKDINKSDLKVQQRDCSKMQPSCKSTRDKDCPSRNTANKPKIPGCPNPLQNELSVPKYVYLKNTLYVNPQI